MLTRLRNWVVNAERRNFVAVCLAVFVSMFCAVYDCSAEPEGSSPPASDSNVLTIKFIPQNGGIMQIVEIHAPPGVPFAVRTNDADGNHYQVTGKLLQKGEHNVGFEQVRVAFQAADGVDGYSGVGPPEMECGREWSAYMVAGLTLYGYSVCYANKTTPLISAVPGAGGLAMTLFVIRGTNTIGGPAIPVGTPVYEQCGTNPPRPLNVKVGPGNTYEEPVGFSIPIVPSPSEAQAQSPENMSTMKMPDDRITFTNKGNIFINGENVGTLSRIVTWSNPLPGEKTGTVTIKEN
ncbi:MAG TPA: hypothetical protein VGO67_26170 [Verrucomicrobiae bacterium]|jgi:hypothetical protein